MAERLSHDEIASLIMIKTIEPPDGPKGKEKEIGFVDLYKEPEFVDLHKPSECGDSQKNRGGSSGLQAPPEAGQPDRKEEQGTAAEDVDVRYEVVTVNEVVAAMPPRDGICCNDKGSKFYNQLLIHILTEKQLRENGYPRPDPENSSTARVYTTSKLEQDSAKLKTNEKICVRCRKKFVIDENDEKCIFHWGKKAWQKRIPGYTERTFYTCCYKDFGVEGCINFKYHVHESNKWGRRTGFLQTLPCPPVPDHVHGVYAMDCEMIYTEDGFELARISVTDCDNRSVYETFVRPEGKVRDYNTRFSGITEEDIKGVTTTIRDVQAVLLSLFTEETILIGHSLECDLAAVKIIHDKVVDTAVVFPHHSGPPFKRALKTLRLEYLNKKTQDDVGGHDSREDAISCMELMQWKVRMDARTEPR